MRTKPCLTLADVKTMIAACEAEAAKNKWAVAISVVDDGGFLLGFQRMGGAPGFWGGGSGGDPGGPRRRLPVGLSTHGRRAGDLGRSVRGQGQNLGHDQAAEQILRGPG